ncbi:hypothetical protein H5395_17365 [Paracoccus sp. MC1854]|uniref:hypothetical protein n=1 Tax=Paracoccus sp. MC1854 TaxID=2760306 RepID=UPI001603250A|nr:hypothetical protein [Paracoccus sp. MC1854]MBB1493228.1 hypothetical protein [Paracoccus sp. MC1854]
MPLFPVPAPEFLKRLPGYYRRWELAELLLPDRYYYLEAAGRHADGEELFTVYAQSGAAARAEGPLQ